ncbi:hypothetical protein K502DRAFT_367601 [Neoconidiobolus thromboides FSU 785]|nr:hypothetical protein K502DRAFT_367601 [Neoconidiobolus thromboides FSU 785]
MFNKTEWFNKILSEIKENGLKDESLMSLFTIFHINKVINSLNLIDEGNVIVLPNSHLFSYELNDKNTKIYCRLKPKCYCTCVEFYQLAIYSSDVKVCHHLLSINLLEAIMESGKENNIQFNDKSKDKLTFNDCHFLYLNI